MATSMRNYVQRAFVLALALVVALFPLSASANCLPCQRPEVLPRSLYNVFTAPLGGDLVVAGQPFNFRWINLDGEIINLVLVKGGPDDLKTVGALAEAVPNKGSYTTVVPNSIPAGNDYAIEMQWGAETTYTPFFTILNPSYA
ncbi:uncharacterized protein SCHCODRAFT_02570106 [Schizophyllum commune H4-8]|uniref:Yeast cell wall synthesis Kre9/Knh1-like N-terminal domain-containing protein n=1 Tax=Schizophyllum commune (strain H4-8 / FGSC 9210) TaxID=578458 RepID=D8PXG6_SCHCM|nr:uncharacterized protein SCHCODRAFT_02570106 [Schizophyllum commune H4-8]KAI5896908.1 hypothetical protein SCHCODRAFT_02570106 [Schizophyllum commune H4-8]